VAESTGGRTTLAARVAHKLAHHAAVQTSPSVHGRVGGAGLPRVEVELAGSRARVLAHVASTWPQPASRTALRVSEAIRAELDRWAGVQVDDLEVVVEQVVDGVTGERRRVS
jgi:hypothetical protein